MPYQPIDCGVYDHFEAAIVQRRPVELVYLDAAGRTVTVITPLFDLKTVAKEEFVLLPSGEWLRLDRVKSIDGVVNGACKMD